MVNPPLRRLTPEDYHVAWVAPLPDVDLLPARLMLDAEHERPVYNTHHDESTYYFGEIYGHTVVIATLSGKGYTGNVNAAHLTGPLFKTFPKIRMTFLVGVGGGVPGVANSGDPAVHLGDVVVGSLESGESPCIYYDFGKHYGANGYELKGPAIPPPSHRVLNGLARLVSDHELDQTCFTTQLNRLRQHPKFGCRFAVPPGGTDWLFAADYAHQQAGADCSGCDQGRVVRRSRHDDGGQPEETIAFHRGRIATGNSVIKSAQERDEISRRCGGALCIETEAAGVSTNGSCLVIRGISNYADSHKNDTWEDCAAGHAAAFARELLRVIPPGAIHRRDIASTAALASNAVDIFEEANELASIQHGQMHSIHDRIDMSADRICQWMPSHQGSRSWLGRATREGCQGLATVQGNAGTGKSSLMLEG